MYAEIKEGQRPPHTPYTHPKMERDAEFYELNQRGGIPESVIGFRHGISKSAVHKGIARHRRRLAWGSNNG